MKKYRVLDLFCGCGGISEGFRLAGCEIVMGIDINQLAIDTYNKNFGECKTRIYLDDFKTIICNDIKDQIKMINEHKISNYNESTIKKPNEKLS